MRKSLMYAILGASMFALVPTDASAWTCRARSPTGAWGWGSNYSLYAAQRRALWECAIRTPRWSRCYITRCY